VWGELGLGLVAFVLGVLLLRRLPVVLALRRPLGAQLSGAAWLGWFGPIGGAAIAYLTTLPRLGVHDPRLWGAGSAVIVASTVVHGVTSTAGQRWLARTG
jgi:NhaP-type Na+/H+ or K+/H+ antiporter